MSTRRIVTKPLSASSDLLTRGKLLAISERRVVPHKIEVAARWESEAAISIKRFEQNHRRGN